MIESLYEDKYLIVCCKPVGLLSEAMPCQKNMPGLLKQQTGVYRIDTLQRLDRNVGGVMVYSKSGKVTPSLMRLMAEHRFTKEYLAVVHGRMPNKQGVMEDYLIKNPRLCKVFVGRESDEKAKFARLSYEVLEEKGEQSLVLVRLITGRTHQIRVQFSHRGFPLVGDTKYGREKEGNNANGKTPIGLWSYHLSFVHPVTHQTVEAYCYPKGNGLFAGFSSLAAMRRENPPGWSSPLAKKQ